MDTLVRNTTLRFSRRRTDGYEPLNGAVDRDAGRARDDDYGRQRTISRPRSHKQHSPYNMMVDSFGQRTFSRPRNQKQQSPVMMNSFSHRRNRARQRQIFLQTYKLESMDSASKCRARKLKKFVVKVKTVVVSVLSFMRGNTLKSCNSGAAICASSPSRIVKIC
ncbi:hypothetical protein ACH5RR_028814 [Cinchona calisaya]|uniref:Uncharacterized protein n=1 Tax=Cinchona calisaya TaxID=153742 RepID=A0ABD2YPW5_9GENT